MIFLADNKLQVIFVKETKAYKDCLKFNLKGDFKGVVGSKQSDDFKNYLQTEIGFVEVVNLQIMEESIREGTLTLGSSEFVQRVDTVNTAVKALQKNRMFFKALELIQLGKQIV